MVRQRLRGGANGSVQFDFRYGQARVAEDECGKELFARGNQRSRRTRSRAEAERQSYFRVRPLRATTFMLNAIVVGAGINGVTAAIELKKRGHKVSLIDPGPLPHPLAASTDISKAVRAAYGADQDYTTLAERSIQLWRKWNQEFGVELYHEVHFLFLRQRAMQPGDFEYESFELLKKRGHNVQRVDSRVLRERFPAWNAEQYPDGFLDLEAGYAESGRVVAQLIEQAKLLGIELQEGSRFSGLDEHNGRVGGIVLDDRRSLTADVVIMAVGAWTP